MTTCRWRVYKERHNNSAVPLAILSKQIDFVMKLGTGRAAEYKKITLKNRQRLGRQRKKCPFYKNFSKNVTMTQVYGDTSIPKSFVRWPKWFIFYFNTNSQFRILKYRIQNSEFRNSEFRIPYFEKKVVDGNFHRQQCPSLDRNFRNPFTEIPERLPVQPIQSDT